MGKLKDAAHHLMNDMQPGVKPTITYVWKNTAGTKMYVIVGCDEFGVINSMILNIGESGTTLHNMGNSLGRVISLALQENSKLALPIIQTLEDFSSDVMWMPKNNSEDMGTAKSIPGVLAKILFRHHEIEQELEAIHTGEETDDE
jgi:hypothetical protein